ncbi:MAG: sulfatase-like hydrolase/transferase [Planctomycetota bacterium]|jgi:arylsulfatase|nr:sulfatase-like hydrolase/transferase [Planctomycetota bacterium]
MTTPNILFLFPDQWRWDWLGCHESGIPVRTPNLDALAARGVRFEQCRTNAPVCAPARACLSTGKRIENCGVPSNKEVCDPSRTTVWQLLRQVGYRVATCGKNDLHKGDQHFTASGWQPLLGKLGFTEAIEHAGKWDFFALAKNRNPEMLQGHLAEAGVLDAYLADMSRRAGIRSNEKRRDHAPMLIDRQHYTDDVCGANALRLLAGFPDAQPWTLWVNFPGPHEPFDPPLELAERYTDVEFPHPINPQAGPDNHQGVRRNYAAMIDGIDEWCGRIIAAIEERGELDNTLIVFCSDHGELLGDHGLWYKGRPQEGSVHVPLIVAGAGVERHGAVSQALVELIDICATMLQAADIPIPVDMEARPLQNCLSAQAADATDSEHREIQVMALYDWRAICDHRYKYVRYDDGRQLLYDRIADPGELEDLSGSLPEIVRSLGHRLELETRAVAG